MSTPPQAPPASREELLHNAILFLNDPKVQSSSLASRITFLEGKGLSDAEIQEALRRASGSAASSQAGPSRVVQRAAGDEYRTAGGGSGSGYGGYGYSQMIAPEPPKRDWRDFFIMAVVSGGLAYGLGVLAQKYLLPHLRPPSTTSFQQTSTSLSAQFAEADRLLAELQTSTAKLQEGLDAEKERVQEVVEGVEAATALVREGEERWREEMREVRGEVESLRELVPRLIEKHASLQSSSLEDLSSELRSLKTLLQSRSASMSGRGTNGSSGPNGTYTAGGVSQTQEAANKLLQPRGKGIPAWQMAPAPSSSSGGGASGQSTPGGSASMGGSGVLENGHEGAKGKEREADV